MSGLLEVVVRHAADAERAEAGGADRLHLVARRPRRTRGRRSRPWSARCAAATTRPIRVMLRLREGFGTDGGELVRLQGLITAYRQVGADGLVLGFLNAHTEVDVAVVTALVGEADFGWTFDRAVDSCISVDRAWRELRRLPGLDQVLTAGSARGVAEGLDDLVARARTDEFARSVIMAGGGLLPEHVPWLARAGVRAFQVGAAVRPLGLDQGLRRRRPGADLADPGRRRDRRGRRRDGLHRPADLAGSRPALVAPGQRHLVRRAARLRGRAGHPARAFERDHYDVIAERYAVPSPPAPAGQLPGDRRPAARRRPPPPQGLPAGPLATARTGRGCDWTRRIAEPCDPRCAHLDATPLTPVRRATSNRSVPTARGRRYWVHLRRCLTCQQVACCDSSPGQARHRPRPGDRTPGGHLGRAGGALALVLRDQVGA